MSNNFSATLVGNLTADPTLTFAPDGTARANFTIAVNDRVQGPDGTWTDKDVVFHEAVVWGRLAERVADQLHNGTAVIATGSLDFSSWTDTDGNRRQGWSLRVGSIGPSVGAHDVTVAARRPTSGPTVGAGHDTPTPQGAGVSM